MTTTLQKNHFEVIDLLAQSISLVPGFQHAYAFYYHPIDKEIQAAYATNDSISTIDTGFDKLSINIAKLRKSKQKIEWVDKNEIPFDKRTKNLEIQKEVFDELKHHILLYRVKNTFDNSYDLLYVFFKADSSNFGIKNSNNNLSTDQKSIISTLITNSFNIFLKQRKENNKAQELLRQDLARVNQYLKKYKSSSEVKKYKKIIKSYIYSTFDIEINKLNLIGNYSEEIDELMNSYTGNINAIQNNVKQCVAMAYRSQNPVIGSIINIDEIIYQSFFSNIENESVTSTNYSAIDSRKQKAVQFLNNLENAARVVLSKGDNITGVKVGQAMEAPITAPAISDYIKKYQKPIKLLCQENPEQWLIIQKSFNPLKNILSA